LDGKVFTTHFEYDGNDALIAINYPTIGGIANRRIVAYGLDAERRITRVFDNTTGRVYATDFAYHPSGGLTSYIAGNGLSTTIAYDPARYWITSVHSGALQLEYDTHDNVGNVTSIRDARGGMNQTFAYDALDRLTLVNGPYSSQFAYDVHGNRRDPSSGAAYQYDPNTLRLMSQYGVPFTYDNNGNLKTAPGRSYAYTPENWLQTSVVDNVVHAYEYDADGWRLKKVTPAGVTYYLRGLNGELLTEWTNPGPSGVIRDYIYAGSRLLTGGHGFLIARFRRHRRNARGGRTAGMGDDCERESKRTPVRECDGGDHCRYRNHVDDGIQLQLDDKPAGARWRCGDVNRPMWRHKCEHGSAIVSHNGHLFRGRRSGRHFNRNDFRRGNQSDGDRTDDRHHLTRHRTRRSNRDDHRQESDAIVRSPLERQCGGRSECVEFNGRSHCSNGHHIRTHQRGHAER
jgi:YD repeat-containing protein